MTTITPNSQVSSAAAIGLAKAMGATPQQISALTTSVSSPQMIQATISAGRASPSGQLFPTSPNNLSVSSSPITSEAMKPQTPVQLPPPPIPSDYFSTVIAGNTALGVKPIDANNPQTAIDTSQNNLQNYFKDYISGIEKPPSLSGEYAQAEKDAGIAQKQQLVSDYTTQLNSITAKAQADQLALVGQGRGIPEVIIGGQQAKIGREAAIQALPVQAQLSAAQGNLQYAQQRLDTLFKLKMEDATNEYNYRKEVRTAVYDFATKSEKARLDNLQRLDDRAYQEKSDFLKTQASLLQSATSQNAPASIISAIHSATDTQGAIMAAGEYGATIKPKTGFELSAGQTRYEYDPKTGKAVAVANMPAKATGITPTTSSETDTQRVLKGEYGDVITSASNLVGAEKGKTTKTAMAEAIAKNDFVSAYAQVANNVEDSLTGEVKTKFANSRTDYGIMIGMRDAIQKYADAGGNMGYLKGTADEIARRFGQLETDPKFASLAIQLQREFQTYRLNMTGAAFSPEESREYAAVNPRTTASLNLNLATIDGALNQLENRITSTVNTRIPNAKKIYDKINNEGMSEDDAYDEYLKLSGQSSGFK